jgi:phosphoglycolate phosphatase-like HAD superfamily hydrolase
MIKTILWDFDGVILDSMKIKGDGFAELFQKYSLNEVQKLQKFHYKNGGVSRFDKIKYFYNKILLKKIYDREVIEHANMFAKIIKKKIFDKKNLIEDSLQFIKKNFKKYNFHIVSGSEHQELNELCKYFFIDRYFISINGSPITKDLLVQNIIKDFRYNNDEVILIGDAITDYNAAKKNQIRFYGYNNVELKNYGYYIENFCKFTL